MIEIISKIDNNSFCPNCHAKLPKELTHIDEIGEAIIFCPYCGTQIILKKNRDERKVDRKLLEISAETKEKEEMKFSLTEKKIRHIIRIFIYRNIYQMIKQKKSIMRRLLWQKDISKSQISYLTSKIRNTLLKTSNPIQETTHELTDPVIRKLDTFYKKFKTSLINKKASREKYSKLLAQNIEFIYNLIRGDYTFEDLSETKRKIVLDLKQFFGFKEESQSKKSVNYNVSLFLAIKIYSIIKQNKNTNLNKSAIDEIINTITEFVIHNDFRNQFFNNLEIYQKRSVVSFLKQFEFNITYNWVYRTSFQDHVFKLIYLVNQLFHENEYWSNLTGSDKLIAEGLRESSLFQNDYEFSAYFRLNLTIILCRIIHKLMQDSPDVPQDISNHPNLNPSLKQKILEYLLKEIIAQKMINFEFLEKFYKLSLEEFQTRYEKFQTKLATDMIYYHSFRDYLGNLIQIIFDITHSIRKKSNLSKLERVFIKDLANYNFRWNPERGNKYYFYSNNKKEDITDNREELIEKLPLIDSESVDFNSGILENHIDMKNMENNIKNNAQIPTSIHSKNRNFKERVINDIRKILTQLEISMEQKERINIVALNILNDFFLKVDNKEVTIHHNSKSLTFASSLIYSVFISDGRLTNLSFRDLSKIAGVNKESIRENYNKYFRSICPRSEFLFTAYNFSNINNVVSLHIFNQIREINHISTSKLLSQIKEMVLNARFLNQLEKKEIFTLEEMFYQYPKTFKKYFSDLIEVVKLITFVSRNHKLIKATLVIRPLVKYLEEKGINLLQQTTTFYKIVREIFDFLAQNYENYFPERLSRAFEENMSKQEYRQHFNRYRQVVGYRLKLYLIKIMSNGKNYVRCPECEKEGFKINTDIIKLNALEFHHQTDKKSEIFTAIRLYELFTENQVEPNFLEKISQLLKLEKVTLVCRNHHMMINDHYFDYFKYFINFRNLFSLNAEEIHILLRIIVDNFRITMNLTKVRKRMIRQRIKNRIKKKYIIEKLFGKKCSICGEFNTKKHIRTFDFCHQDPQVKTVQASTLFNSYSCSEIAEILRKERGAYICSNCHTVYDMDYYNVIDEIYDNKEIVKNVKDDYHKLRINFTPISKTMVRNVKDPLQKIIVIKENIINYFTTIYELSQKNINATNKTISNYLGVDYSAVKSFFLRRRTFLENYLDFPYGRPIIYTLNHRGKFFVSLINYFKQYYRSLELDECQDCNLNSKKECLANNPDECSIIKLGNHLPFEL